MRCFLCHSFTLITPWILHSSHTELLKIHKINQTIWHSMRNWSSLYLKYLFFLPRWPSDIHSLLISGKYILYMKAFSAPDQVKMTFEGKGQKLRGNKQTNKQKRNRVYLGSKPETGSGKMSWVGKCRNNSLFQRVWGLGATYLFCTRVSRTVHDTLIKE